MNVLSDLSNSDNVIEGTLNKYFTESKVLSTTLVGFSAVSATVTTSDSIITAVSKLQGQINVLISGGGAPVSTVFGRIGNITAQSSDYSSYYLTLTGGSLTGNLNGVTPTEITYLSGVTSTIQTQLNNKTESIQAINGLLTSVSGICNWTITNTLNTVSVIVQIYDNSSLTRIEFPYVVSTSSIIISIYSATNISASTYNVTIIATKI